MTPQALYRNAVPLDGNTHRALKFKPFADHQFAAGIGIAPLAAIEIPSACRDYPVVFTRLADGSLGVFALLGAREGENRYLDAAGRWNARYVPAFIRRYPFIFAAAEDNRLALCIDQDCANLQDDAGEPLFTDAGEPAPLLANALQFLAAYQADFERGREFLRKLDAAGVLRPASFNIQDVDGKPQTLIDGLLIVDEASLPRLPDAVVRDWLMSGDLARIHAHLISLANLAGLQPVAAEVVTTETASEPTNDVA